MNDDDADVYVRLEGWGEGVTVAPTDSGKRKDRGTQ